MKSFVCNELEPFAYLLYALAVFIQYNRHTLFRHKVLLFYYLTAAISLYAGIVITSYLNNWSYNALFFITICVFSWYFHSLLYTKLKRRIIALCCIANVFIFVYFNIIEGAFFSHFNGPVYGISFITIVLYTLLYFHQLLADVKEENLLLNFDFWLICGYLMYFLGTFVIIVYYENALGEQRGDMWAIQNVILFICSVVTVIVSFRISAKQIKTNG